LEEPQSREARICNLLFGVDAVCICVLREQMTARERRRCGASSAPGDAVVRSRCEHVEHDDAIWYGKRGARLVEVIAADHGRARLLDFEIRVGTT
jgi:hypothetical protein